jgi:hypothetical protein
MPDWLLLSDLFRHSLEFPTCAGDVALGVVLLRRAHLRQRFRQPTARTP